MGLLLVKSTGASRPPVAGAMVYKGAHSSLTTAPSSPDVGFVYVLTTTGILTWVGQTFNPSAVVEVNDSVIYRGSNVWDVMQGNSIPASTTNPGLIQIATTSTVNTGVDGSQAVVPSTLTAFVNTKAFARTYFNGSVTLVANTPLNILHSLGLQDKDSYTISVKNSQSREIAIRVVSVDANNVQLTSSVALTSVKVTIIGF